MVLIGSTPFDGGKLSDGRGGGVGVGEMHRAELLGDSAERCRGAFGRQQHGSDHQIAVVGSYRETSIEQAFGYVAPKPAGGIGGHVFHGRKVRPLKVSPAAVPIRSAGRPGISRPLENATCNALGIEAATWFPCSR